MIVTRYMVGDPRQRICAFTFDAGDVDVIEPTTTGSVTFASRDTPDDVWGPPKNLAPSVEYATWVATIERDGFVYEDRSA